jgi:hypothetical protein
MVPQFLDTKLPMTKLGPLWWCGSLHDGLFEAWDLIGGPWFSEGGLVSCWHLAPKESGCLVQFTYTDLNFSWKIACNSSLTFEFPFLVIVLMLSYRPDRGQKQQLQNDPSFKQIHAVVPEISAFYCLRPKKRALATSRSDGIKKKYQ